MSRAVAQALVRNKVLENEENEDIPPPPPPPSPMKLEKTKTSGVVNEALQEHMHVRQQSTLQRRKVKGENEKKDKNENGKKETIAKATKSLREEANCHKNTATQQKDSQNKLKPIGKNAQLATENQKGVKTRSTKTNEGKSQNTIKKFRNTLTKVTEVFFKKKTTTENQQADIASSIELILKEAATTEDFLDCRFEWHLSGECMTLFENLITTSKGKRFDQTLETSMDKLLKFTTELGILIPSEKVEIDESPSCVKRFFYTAPEYSGNIFEAISNTFHAHNSFAFGFRVAALQQYAREYENMQTFHANAKELLKEVLCYNPKISRNLTSAIAKSLHCNISVVDTTGNDIRSSYEVIGNNKDTEPTQVYLLRQGENYIPIFKKDQEDQKFLLDTLRLKKDEDISQIKKTAKAVTKHAQGRYETLIKSVVSEGVRSWKSDNNGKNASFVSQIVLGKDTFWMKYLKQHNAKSWHKSPKELPKLGSAIWHMQCKSVGRYFIAQQLASEGVSKNVIDEFMLHAEAFHTLRTTLDNIRDRDSKAVMRKELERYRTLVRSLPKEETLFSLLVKKRIMEAKPETDAGTAHVETKESSKSPITIVLDEDNEYVELKPQQDEKYKAEKKHVEFGNDNVEEKHLSKHEKLRRLCGKQSQLQETLKDWKPTDSTTLEECIELNAINRKNMQAMTDFQKSFNKTFQDYFQDRDAECEANAWHPGVVDDSDQVEDAFIFSDEDDDERLVSQTVRNVDHNDDLAEVELHEANIDQTENIKSTEKESEQGTSDENLTITELCEIFGLSEEDAKFQPPKECQVALPQAEVSNCFDFNKNKFKLGVWPISINEAISEMHVCSFNADSGVKYHKQGAKTFARMTGYCGGGCDIKFEIIIPKKPIKGDDMEILVKTKGEFTLRQSKSTGRQIRSSKRKQVAEKLQNQSAEKLFLKNTTKTTVLQLLHRNELQKSEETLRKLKSEANKSKRAMPMPIDDLMQLKKKLQEEHHQAGAVNGFIQKVECEKPDELLVYMYDRESILLHHSVQQRGISTLHIDASGGFVGKHATTGTKQIMSYLVIGRSENGCSYPLAEMLTQSANMFSLGELLQRIRKDRAALIPSTVKKNLADIIVCDNSFSMVQGILKGALDCTLQDYLAKSYDILSGKSPSTTWNRPCITICASHLVKGVSRNLSKKIGNDNVGKAIKRAALNGVARLQECDSLTEIDGVSEKIVRLFGCKFLSEDLESHLLKDLQRKKDKQDIIEIVSSIEDGLYSEEDTVSFLDMDSVKERSRFYQKFRFIADQVLEDAAESSQTRANAFYCPKVIELLQDRYIPYSPLWGRALPRQTVDKTFQRLTNGSVEGHYYLKKSTYHTKRNVFLSDYCRENFDFHVGRVRSAANLFDKRTGKKHIPDQLPKEQPAKEFKGEKWSKRRKKKDAIYFSPKSTQQSKPTLRQLAQADQEVKTPETQVKERATTSAASRKKPKNQALIKINETSILSEGDDHCFQLRIKNFRDLYSQSGAITDEWITDDIMNAYMNFLQQQLGENKIMTLYSHFATAIADEKGDTAWTSFGSDEKNSRLTSPAQKEFLDNIPQECKTIIFPLFHCNHWILLEVDLKQKECIVYDSNEPSNMHDRSSFRSEVTQYFLKKLDCKSSGRREWTVMYGMTEKQVDLVSCGYIVTSNARRYFESGGIAVGDLKGKVNIDEEKKVLIRSLLNTELGKKIKKATEGNDELLMEVIFGLTTELV